MDYDNTNRGAIFRNEKKSTEKHPDMNGSINIEGKEYWISGWSNVSKQVLNTYHCQYLQKMSNLHSLSQRHLIALTLMMTYLSRG